jgi:rSAM/selenodomain-associated transferase 1
VTRIHILAKNPIPGHAKTRLQPLLGAEGAAALHGALLQHTLTVVRASGIPSLLHLDSEPQPRLRESLDDCGQLWTIQVSGDLGQRMSACMREGERSVVIGTDCPFLAPEWLGAAAQSQHPLVLGPAEDGGYWLIALRLGNHPVQNLRICSALFERMQWSTDRVLVETLGRARNIGLDVGMLPSSWDLDLPEDVLRLRRHPACPALLLPHLF